MTQATSLKTLSSSVSTQDIISTGSRVLASILSALRIISSAWEESRAEYKKHAILGGGWE